MWKTLYFGFNKVVDHNILVGYNVSKWMQVGNSGRMILKREKF
ncbi:MAG: hypothetical protein V1698_00665 [bacterium]